MEKNGFLTSEFWSQAPGYVIAAVIIYMVMGDSETMRLVEQAMSALRPDLQALIMIGLRVAGMIGGSFVAGRAAQVSRSYAAGRSKMKIKAMERRG